LSGFVRVGTAWSGFWTKKFIYSRARHPANIRPPAKEIKPN
jgi:hypothetical protein